MIAWDAGRVAAEAGAELLREGSAAGGEAPPRAAVDTRVLAAGELFVGLRGAREDGGERAGEALAKGGWGVLVAPEHARTAAASASGGAVLSHPEPLLGLQRLARAWRRELGGRGAAVIAITGSTGKTSTKDILAALLSASMPTAASPANLNTEIGLPLAILAAPGATRALVLEMAMRGTGQIAELTAIAEPDVGVIVNVGPAHLELLGSLANIAAAKAELIAGLRPGMVAVVPAGEDLLAPHMREDLRTLTFGEGGDVTLLGLADPPGAGTGPGVRIGLQGEEIELWPSFSQAHNVQNLLAAVAAAAAVGQTPGGRLEVAFSAMRGQRERLASGAVLIDDCYNANPMSMRAAIDELAATAPGRRVAVLGDMLELGPDGPALHREIGAHARARGVEVLVTVGPLAAAIGEGFGGATRSLPDAAAAAAELGQLLEAGDTVLVKGSRGVGLERACEALRRSTATRGGASGPAGSPRPLVPGQR
jgi:UDP-N-acetylmuramoyl-tripeptide--D-alanyl-D-alanine ligase